MKKSQKENLPDIADCHIACFPKSLATRLGEKYVEKTFDWFLQSPKRFLFHIEEDNQIIGYCGGFIPSKVGDGSSSGMVQHAFNEAVKGLIFRPWLLLHNEVLPQYPFIWRNIKRKITGKMIPAKASAGKTTAFKTYTGLVVIGVHPSKRGTGVVQQLLEEFERKSLELKQPYLVLSVKKENARAIKVYSNYGWYVKEEDDKTFVLHKSLESNGLRTR